MMDVKDIERSIIKKFRSKIYKKFVRAVKDFELIKEGDVIFYRIDTAVPVPFFKQGFVSLAESQIIAVVNEGLQDRFNNIK